MNEKLISKKTTKPRGIIIFIPGIFTDFKKSNFKEMLRIKSDFDFLTYNIYTNANKNNIHKGIKDLVEDFSTLIKEVSQKYKNIFVISYSFGSEIVLRSKEIKKIRAMAFWSPSFAYPQNVTSTLKTKKMIGKDKVLIHKNNLISEKLAKELDKLNTEKLLNNINRPLHIFISTKEKSGREWFQAKILKKIPIQQKSISKMPYKHNHNSKEVVNLYKLTTNWFSKFISGSH